MATRGLGTLTIDFIAKTGGFEQGMDRAQRAMKRTGAAVETESKKIERYTKAATLAITGMGAAMVASAAAIYKSSAQNIDSLNKMARQIGISTEALSGMRFAAQQVVNISDSNFDLAMRRMTRRISEAAQGSGAASKALQGLGVSAKELASLSPDQQFKRLADAMGNVEERGKQLQYTMAIFDTQGMPLVDVLAQGSDEFDKLIDKAQRFGATISDIDAQAVEDAQSALADAFSLVGAFGDALTIEIAPYVRDIANSFVYVADSLGGFSELVSHSMNAIVVAATLAAGVIGGRLVQAFAAKTRAAALAAAENYKYQRSLYLMGQGVSSTAAQTATLTAAQTAGAAATTALSVATRTLSVALGVVGGPLGALTLALTGATALWASHKSSVEENRRVLAELSGPIDDLISRYNQLTEAQKRAYEIKYLEAFEQAGKDQKEVLASIAQEMLKVDGVFTSVNSEASRGLIEVSKRLEETASSGGNLLDVLRDAHNQGIIDGERLVELEKLAGKFDDAKESGNNALQMLDALQHAMEGMYVSANNAASGVDNLGDSLEGAAKAGADFAERLRLQSITAGLKGVREQLDAMVEAGEYAFDPEQLAQVQAWADTIDNANKPVKSAKTSTDKLASSIKSLVGDLFPVTKATEELAEKTATLDAALKRGIISANQHAQGIKTLTDNYRKQLATQVPAIKAIQDESRAIESQIKALRKESAERKVKGSALASNTRLEVESRIATLQSTLATTKATDANSAHVIQLQEEIKALQERSKLLGEYIPLAAQSEAAAQYRETAEEIKRMNEQIADAALDSMMRMFEDTKGGFKDLVDWAKNLFKTLVLRPILQPIVSGAAGAVTGALGLGGASGSAAADTLGVASGLKNIAGGLSWFTDFSGNVGKSLFDVGMGLQDFDGALGSLGDTILGNIDSISQFADYAGQAFGYGSAIYNLTKGNYGSAAGGALGTAFGGPVGGALGTALGGLVDGLFKGGETRAGGGFFRDYATGQTFYGGGPSGGYGGQATMDAMDKTLSQFAGNITGVLDALDIANVELSKTIGTFESSSKGRGGTSSGGSLIIDGHEIFFGSTGPQGQGRKGAGYGGRSGSAEEMFENMTRDMAYSTLEAWQLVADQMPVMIGDMLREVNVRGLAIEQAEALQVEIQSIVGTVVTLQNALGELPFQGLTELTFELSYAMLEAVGSAEALMGGFNAFFDGFYSEAEKVALASEQFLGAMSELGVQVPSTAQGFRDLVNGINVVDDESAQLKANLLSMSGMAAQFYQAASAHAQEQLSEQVQAASKYYNRMKELARSSYDSQIKDIRAQYDRQKKVISDSLKSVNETLRDLQQIVTAVQRSMDSLNSASAQAQEILRQQARDTISQALEAARSGQSISGMSGLQDAVGTAGRLTSDAYSTLQDFERERLTTLHDLAELAGYADDQVDVQEMQLEALEAQSEQLDEWRKASEEAAKARMESLINYYDGAFEREKERLERQHEEQIAQFLKQNEALLQGMNADAEHTNNMIATMHYTTGQIASAIRSININPIVNVSVPGFASGGDHLGGLHVAGELGPELRLDGPARYFNANQTEDILRNAFNRANQSGEDSLISDSMMSLGKLMDKVLMQMEKWDRNGMPETREEDLIYDRR